jgi:hypothetical protein
VYRDCAVDRRARLVRHGDLSSYRPPSNVSCLKAELEFVVDADGRPEVVTAKVISASEPAFGEALLESLPGWRYAPAQKAGVAVRQIVRERQAIAKVAVAVSSGGASRPTPLPIGSQLSGC